MKTISHQELVAMPPVEVPSVLGERLLIPGGRFVLYGPPGLYKSFAVQTLLYCLSEGLDWFGFPVYGRHKTLYVELEIPQYMTKLRAESITEGWPGEGAHAHYSTEYDWVLDSKGKAEELKATIRRVGADIVVLDPIYLVMRGSENDDRAWKDFLFLFNDILGATGALGGVVHHDNKGLWHEGRRVDRGMADLSGRRELAKWADTIIRVKPIEDVQNRAELKWEKVRHGPKPESLWLRFDTTLNRLFVAENDPRGLVLRFLESGPRPIEEVRALLKDECGLGIHKAAEVRQGMVTEGIVEELPDPSNHRRKLLRIRRPT